jgi:hypothetical protein
MLPGELIILAGRRNRVPQTLRMLAPHHPGLSIKNSHVLLNSQERPVPELSAMNGRRSYRVAADRRA